MVRFEKFEIWHTRDSEPDLICINDVTRDVSRARWRHAREWRHLWRHHDHKTKKPHLETMEASLALFLTCLAWQASINTERGLKSPEIIRFWRSKELDPLKKGCLFAWNTYFADQMVGNVCFLPLTHGPVGCHGNRRLKPDSGPTPYIPAKFGARGPINSRGVKRQTNPMQTQIIVRLVLLILLIYQALHL